MNQYMFFFIYMVVWGPNVSFITENNSHTVCVGDATSKASLMPWHFPDYIHSYAELDQWGMLFAQLVNSSLSHSHLWLGLGYMCRVAHKADEHASENGFSAVYNSVKMLQRASTVSWWMFHLIFKLFSPIQRHCLHTSPTSTYRVGLASFPQSLWALPDSAFIPPFQTGVVPLIWLPSCPASTCTINTTE